MGIATGLQGSAKRRVVQLHRLLLFEQTFTKYLEGKATALQVKQRAVKMLESGLPSRLR